MSKEKLRHLDEMALELLTPEDRREYAQAFGVESETELLSVMGEKETKLDRTIRKRLGQKIKNRAQFQDLLWAMADYVGLPRAPVRPVCVGHCSPFDPISDAFFGFTHNYLKHANRHGYKTMGDAFLLFSESVQFDSCKSKILGGSKEQSKATYEYIQDFADIPACRDYLKSILTEKARFINKSEVAILTQSTKSVRGPHPQKLRLDEVEEFDPGVFKSALSQTRSFGGVQASIGMSSTHHKRAGIMASLLKDHTSRGIDLYQWCIFEVMEKCTLKSCEFCETITKVSHEGETVSFRSFCKGKAKKANGYYSLEEVLEKFALLTLEDFMAEWLCLSISLSGYVFPKFDRIEEGTHVTTRAQYDPNLPLTRTWDFGWSGATAILWIQVDGHRQKRIIDEAWFVMTPLPEICRIVWAKPYKSSTGRILDYGDPAGKGGKDKVVGIDDITYLKTQGIDVKSRGSGIPEGLRLINAALEITSGMTELIIHPKCTHTIDYLDVAKYPVDASGSPISEIPVKDGKEHSGDALRYWFVNNERIQVPIAYGGSDGIQEKRAGVIQIPQKAFQDFRERKQRAAASGFGSMKRDLRRSLFGG